MIELTVGEVAVAVGGRLHRCRGTEKITGSVEFDSRRVGPGGLFVALPGERVDGHAFAAAAVRSGATAVLAAREVDAPSIIVPPIAVPSITAPSITAPSMTAPVMTTPSMTTPAAGASPAGAYVLAGDTDGSGAAVLAALAALARTVVDRLTAGRGQGAPGLTVIGITGSAGKTSTKDLVAALLRPLGSTVAPPGSFNNELGHPWTVLRAGAATRHLVLELSARGPGHIAALCRAAPPRIGVVLNVGSAHLGEFGSREAIAMAKGELVEALPPDGVAVLNADDPAVAAMAARTAARTVLVGRSARAQIRAEGVSVDASGRARFRLVTPDGQAPVLLGVHGEHQVGNALAAAATALQLGAALPAVAAGLTAATPVSRWRMEVTQRPDGLTVINDAYNANPESVLAALRTLAAMTAGSRGANAGGANAAGVAGGGRGWAVLGPIAELGAAADAAHEEIGRAAARLGVHRLLAVGAQAHAVHHGARREGLTGEESVLVPDVEAAIALLRDELRPGDVVLVKASRAFGLERVADALLADPAGEGAGA